MNILVINWQDWRNPLSGGAEVHLHETFKRVAAMGHSVTLLCSGFPGAPREEMLDGIHIIRRGERNFFNYVVPFVYLFSLRKEKFDVVVDDLNKIPFYSPIFVRRPLVGLSHHFFGKSIFLEAGPVFGSYVYGAEKSVDWFYKRTPFLVVSQSTLDEFVARGFKRENFALAMNALDHEKLHPAGIPKTPYPSVGYFGRLKKYKSVDHVLRAFARVRETLPDAKLVIIGRGDFQPALESLAKELRIADATRFTGFVSEEEKQRLLEELWVVVNPSMKEGWGIVNVEANACGTPAIAADTPGLRDSVKHNETGMLYPYGNIEKLTEDMLEILQNREVRERLGTNALAFARSLTWEKTAEETVKFLEEVVRKKKVKN